LISNGKISLAMRLLKIMTEHQEMNDFVKATFDLEDKNNVRVLHAAAKTGRCHIIKEYLRNSELVNQTNHDGDTALHIAALRGHECDVRALLEVGAKSTQCQREDRLDSSAFGSCGKSAQLCSGKTAGRRHGKAVAKRKEQR
jgi:hypothetical protein